MLERLHLLEGGASRPLNILVHDDTVINLQIAARIAACVDHRNKLDIPVADDVWQLRDVCRRLGVTPKVVEVLDVLTAGSDIELPLTDEQEALMNPPLAWALNTYGSARQQLLDCVTLGCLTRRPLEE